MKRCYECKSEDVETGVSREETYDFAPVEVVVQSTGWTVCRSCGEATITADGVRAAQRTAARIGGCCGCSSARCSSWPRERVRFTRSTIRPAPKKKAQDDDEESDA